MGPILHLLHEGSVRCQKLASGVCKVTHYVPVEIGRVQVSNLQEKSRDELTQKPGYENRFWWIAGGQAEQK